MLASECVPQCSEMLGPNANETLMGIQGYDPLNKLLLLVCSLVFPGSRPFDVEYKGNGHVDSIFFNFSVLNGDTLIFNPGRGNSF